MEDTTVNAIICLIAGFIMGAFIGAIIGQHTFISSDKLEKAQELCSNNRGLDGATTFTATCKNGANFSL